MDMVKFRVKLNPESAEHYRLALYSAQFLDEQGRLVQVETSSRLHSASLEESYSMAWLLSAILGDFMAEAGGAR